MTSWTIKINLEPVVDDDDADGSTDGAETEVPKEAPDIEFPLLIVIPTLPPITTRNTSIPTTTPKPGPEVILSSSKKQGEVLNVEKKCPTVRSQTHHKFHLIENSGGCSSLLVFSSLS